MSTEAMKLALEALEIGLAYPGMRFYHDNIRAAITALRDAIAEAEKQEPVAWICNHYEAGMKNDVDYWQNDIDALPVGTPLYTTPHAAQRQPLTDEQIDDIWNRYCDEMGEASINDAYDIARAIEAAHGIKEKNT